MGLRSLSPFHTAVLASGAPSSAALPASHRVGCSATSSPAPLVVELDGPTMMARIGMLRALNRHVERVFNTDRKDKHWGKRKIKRDE